MNTSVMLASILFAAPTIGYRGALPDERHAWFVHDPNRPNPAKVAVCATGVPSDAVVLFDGSSESVSANWCDKDGQPTKWKAQDGTLVCTPGSGQVFTRRRFADCQLHVEWLAPADEPVEAGSDRGNSGVYLGGRYEIQVLESFGTDPERMTNPNYADGQAGALYGQHPPLVNPARRAGEWQSFDVVYHPACWQDGRRVRPATVTVFYNGVLVHDARELEGPTDWVVRAQPREVPPEGPLMLQDHGHPVPYRNIWIRPIPKPGADKVNGGAAADETAVMRLREKTGAASFALVKDGVFDFANAERAIEAAAYSPTEGHLRKMSAVCEGLARAIREKGDAWASDRDRLSDLDSMQHLCELMVGRRLMSADDPLPQACAWALARARQDPRCTFSLYIIEGARQSGISLKEAIDRTLNCGIRAIDVGLDEVAPAQQMCAAGMHVVSVYWQVRFLDADNGEKTGDELLAAAKALGSPRMMVLPQDFPKGGDRKACMARTVEGLRKLVAKAKRAGVVVTVEDFGSADSPCASIALLKEMFDAIPDLKLTLDTGNFYGLEAKDDPVEAMRLFRDRIVHCHVKDYRKGAPGAWCPLGKGCIPNETIVKALMSSGYEGCFTIEESQAPDYLKAVADAERRLSRYLPDGRHSSGGGAWTQPCRAQ